jgi:hypothetical protein
MPIAKAFRLPFCWVANTNGAAIAAIVIALPDSHHMGSCTFTSARSISIFEFFTPIGKWCDARIRYDTSDSSSRKLLRNNHLLCRARR